MLKTNDHRGEEFRRHRRVLDLVVGVDQDEVAASVAEVIGNRS